MPSCCRLSAIGVSLVICRRLIPIDNEKNGLWNNFLLRNSQLWTMMTCVTNHLCNFFCHKFPHCCLFLSLVSAIGEMPTSTLFVSLFWLGRLFASPPVFFFPIFKVLLAVSQTSLKCFRASQIWKLKLSVPVLCQQMCVFHDNATVRILALTCANIAIYLISSWMSSMM